MDSRRNSRKRPIEPKDDPASKIRRVESSNGTLQNAEQINTRHHNDDEQEIEISGSPSQPESDVGIVSRGGESSELTFSDNLVSHSQLGSDDILTAPRKLQDRLSRPSMNKTRVRRLSQNDKLQNLCKWNLRSSPSNFEAKSKLALRLERIRKGLPPINKERLRACATQYATATATATNESSTSNSRSDVSNRLERIRRGMPPINEEKLRADATQSTTATVTKESPTFNISGRSLKSSAERNLWDVPDPCILDSETFYIILDTNVFIHNFSHIKYFTHATIHGKNCVVYVPWIVLKELDELKRRRDIKSDVTKAINFIESHLRSGVIKGQKGSDQDHLIEIHVSDDYIIDCCLKVKKVTTSMILCTNDTNLRAKSIMHNIRTAAPLDLIKLIKNEV